jgi:hypothetical protein
MVYKVRDKFSCENAKATGIATLLYLQEISEVSMNP